MISTPSCDEEKVSKAGFVHVFASCDPDAGNMHQRCSVKLSPQCPRFGQGELKILHVHVGVSEIGDPNIVPKIVGSIL